ncbi:MAG: type II toxin-antitoxin system VapC family toxin [Rhodothermia bacterium]|nr:MAG: type II toxin-antitoxin system VapC family toxin [Rhodothermia bacterium]
MLITLDTSVIMAVLLEEPSKKNIISQTQGADLQAPPSLPWEVGNALSSLMRRNLLDAEAASTAISVFDTIPIRFAEIDLDSVVRLVDLHSMWAYDAYAIECARKYRTPLMSLDKAQCRIAVTEGIDILEIAS